MEVRQNGQPLVLGCCSFEIPSSLTGQQLPDPQMQLFNGRIEADTGDLVWDLDREQKAPGETPGVIAGGPSQTNYSMFVQQFGWSNVDRFYSDPRPKTDLLVTVPEGYDDTNSAVYLSYDGEQSGLAHLDRYDDQTGEFSEHYGRIPVGLEAHLVFASESNGQWVYATKSVTITDGAVLSINETELETGTEAEMLSEIEQLP